MAEEHDLRTYFTLAEMKNRMVNNELQTLVDVLTTPLSIINDVLIGPGNDGDEDIVTRTLYEPQGSEVMYGQGAPKVHGQAEQVVEYSAIIRQPWDMPVDVADRTGNRKLALFQEEQLQMNGLRKRWEQRIFHGDRSAAAANGAHQINGLANRDDYKYLNASSARPWMFDNSLGGTPSADANKSRIWFIKHSPIGMRWFYPQGSGDSAGIKREYWGERTEDETDYISSEATVKRILEGQLSLAGGISIKDPRAVCCLANISMDSWDDDDEFDISPEAFINAMNYMDAVTADIPGQTIIYMNSAVRARMWLLQSDLTLTRTQNQVLNQPEWMVNGMPIHVSNQISITETKLTTP